MSEPVAGPVLNCAGRLVDLSEPRVMGVLNVTPDSFSDGGSLLSAGRPSLDKILQRASAMVAAGAVLLDVGGESTRPGAAPVSEQAELDRVIPVVERLSQEFDTIISVDTSTPAVMTSAARAGAGMLNDVRSLERDGALAAAATTGVPICLMHWRGEPAVMQHDPHYDDVVAEVIGYLGARVEASIETGIPRNRLLIDPGFGFGKTAVHNLTLLNQLLELQVLELPVLVGLSRKSLIQHVLGRPVEERLAGSLALATMAMLHGARIVRAHDVQETVDAARLCQAVMASRPAAHGAEQRAT